MRAGELWRGGARIGLCFLAAIVVMAVLAPVITRHPPELIDPRVRLRPPSSAHWFGTDDLGRDIFSRVVHGARVSLLVGAVVAVSSAALGAVLGMLAGYHARVDGLVMRVVDALLAFPGVLLAIVVVVSLGARLTSVLIALTLMFAPGVARLVRSVTTVVRGQPFVESARALGMTDRRVLGRHVLPHVMSPLAVQTTFVAAYAILAEASLSFLGASVGPGTPTWGAMLSDGQRLVTRAWWVVIPAGTALFLTVLSATLVGDALRDSIDPWTRGTARLRDGRRGGARVGPPPVADATNAPMGDLLTAHADAQPDKLAVIDDRTGGDVRTSTYAELEARAKQLVHVLLEVGAQPGDKIVWCGQNSTGIVEIVNASRKLGATAVPLNYRLSDEEAAYVTDHCDATTVYVDAEYAPLFERIRGQIPKVRNVLVFDGAAPDGATGMTAIDALVAAAPTAVVEVPERDAGGATMIYTSGTTGKPKGAFRRNVAVDPRAGSALLQHIGYRPDDIYITTGPLYHSGPGGFMSSAIAMGQTVVLQRKFDPEDWLRLVDTYRASSTFSAPTPIRMICNLPDEVKARYDRSSMRIMIANAAPWSYALKQQYVAAFPPESLWEIYGSTELGVNTVLRPEDQMRKPGSCGTEAPMVEIRLYDELGNIVTGTGPEATGELFVRSAAVFNDYYKQHDKFEEDHRDGFQTVGDIAYRDDEGFLYICDRKKDMIISGGMNIYPAEIEAALEAHPDIYEAAVFGIPSEEWGELVHAVVVARAGSSLDEEAVKTHAREHLASYKIPRSLSWMDELPKTGSGKILKRELRAPYWADRTTNV